MFYEEREIDGVLYYRTLPNGRWYQFDAAMLMKRIGEMESALAAERARSAAMIEAWPTESSGAILDAENPGRWWLRYSDGVFWGSCPPGPYPTREAAILALLESRKPTETTPA